MTQAVVVRAGGNEASELSARATATPRWCINGTVAIQLPAQATRTSLDWIRWNAATRLPLPPETPEERALRERNERLRAAAEQQRIAEQERQAATTRARELLIAHLTDEQRAEFEAHQRFHVTSSAGRRFEIEYGQYHNVYLLDDDGRRVTRYCGYFPSVPLEDNILAQKMLIEKDEARYLSSSNASRVQ